jgi:hypothetical protein
MIQVDEILHDFIDEKIADLKANPMNLDRILEGHTHARVEEFKEFFVKNPIRTTYHFPRDASELPCYAIVLDTCPETDQVIGMSGDNYDEAIISYMDDGWIGSDSDISPTRTNIFAPTDVGQFYSSIETLKNGRRSCHLVGKPNTSVGKGIFIDFETSVLGGYVDLSKVAYVVFPIKSNRTGTFLEFGFGQDAHQEYVWTFPVTTSGVWEYVRVDIREVDKNLKSKVRYMSFTITDDTMVTDIYIDKLVGNVEDNEADILEAFFDPQYRIEVWTNNAEVTIMMWDVVKWLLLRYRYYLETSFGLLSQKLGGGDVVPQPDYYPEFVYIRSLEFTCKLIETIPTEMTRIEHIRIGRTDFGHLIQVQSA